MKQSTRFVVSKGMMRDLCAESPRARLLHRLHAVALVAHGLSSSEVARIFDDSPRAVAYWVKRFKQDGLPGLQEESRPGRPPKLTPAQLRKVQTFLKISQADSRPMTARMLMDHIRRQFRVSLTVSQCWRIVKRLNK